MIVSRKRPPPTRRMALPLPPSVERASFTDRNHRGQPSTSVNASNTA